MTSYYDLIDLANSYNLTGNFAPVSAVPGIELDEDENGNHIVTYT